MLVMEERSMGVTGVEISSFERLKKNNPFQEIQEKNEMIEVHCNALEHKSQVKFQALYVK